MQMKIINYYPSEFCKSHPSWLSYIVCTAKIFNLAINLCQLINIVRRHIIIHVENFEF